METAKPALPFQGEACASINGWTATRPRFAALLGTGLPAAHALSRWALELLRANEIPDAIAVLRAALSLAPGDPVLWTNYGIALGQSNAPEQEAACLEYSLVLLREQPDTWLMLGLARKKAGNLAAAETAYREALQQEPNSGVAWQLLGVLKEEQREFAGAIDCLNASVKAGGANAATFANLGKLHYQLGRFAGSAGAYDAANRMDPANAHYRQLARKTHFVRSALENEAIEEAIRNYRNSFATGESCADAELRELFHTSFSQLSGFGHTEAAARVGRKHLELWPDDPSMTYLLSAVADGRIFDRSPPAYVVEHFDAFAGGFDAKLVGVLGYDIPEKICAALREISADGRLHDTLDAGCGTGLCGRLLRPISRALTGVDLSPKMLEQAAGKSVYDRLTCEELTTFLHRSPNHFDLIVAADLMIYFGDVAPVFAAAATALRPGGLFAFSTELWTGAGYRLLPSGRFAQAPDYVQKMAGQEFAEVFHADTTIRLEAAARLAGSIFIFRRRD
jgi:predicted TPR repeat methyltransferase/Tfp pilus assembly protein PilF